MNDKSNVNYQKSHLYPAVATLLRIITYNDIIKQLDTHEITEDI